MSWKRTQTKNKRNKLTGGKSVSSHCRNNGSCEYCRRNRMIATLKNKQKIKEELDEAKEM